MTSEHEQQNATKQSPILRDRVKYLLSELVTWVTSLGVSPFVQQIQCVSRVIPCFASIVALLLVRRNKATSGVLPLATLE